jgi:hypothetical protein
MGGSAIVQHDMRVTLIRLIRLICSWFIASSPPMRMAAGGLAGRVAADPAGGFSGWSL